MKKSVDRLEKKTEKIKEEYEANLEKQKKKYEEKLEKQKDEYEKKYEAKLEKQKNEYEEKLEKQRREYDEKYEKRIDKHSSELIAMKPSHTNNHIVNHNNHNNNTNILNFSDKERLNNVITSNITEDVVLKGQEGVANILFQKYLKDEQGKLLYTVTDASRQNFEYVDERGEVQHC
jgi:transketolase